MRTTAALAATIALLVAPGVAQAQAGDESAARVHFESGRVHFDNGNYEAALREFEAAYELSSQPELLYNLYLAVERLGRFDAAIAHLERYLAEGDPAADRRAALDRRLAHLRQRRAREREEAPAPGATAAGVGGTPESAGAGEGGPGPVDGASRAASGDGDGTLLPAIVAFSVAGAGLVGFVVFGAMALGEDGDLGDGCGATRSCSDEDVSTLSTLNTLADVSLIVAAAAAIAGVALALTVGASSDDGPRDVARLVPVLGPRGAGLVGEVTF